MSKSLNLLIGAGLAVSVLSGPVLAGQMGLGRPALPEEIAAWDMTVLPDGTGLRPGSGDVLTGEEVFGEKCASCHGEFAEGIDSWPVLAGGQGTLTDRRPVKTIGSYWPHLSTVWDYVHRSMPFGAAQTVTVDETYAITAYLLYSNGLVEDDFVLSDQNFAEIRLPNEAGFFPDDRPESEYPMFRKEPCMTNCGAPVKVTKRAVDLRVTPTDPDGRPAGTLPELMIMASAAAAPSAEPSAAMEAAAPAAAASPAIDPNLIADGEKVFKKCAACHKVGEGAKNGTGPQLNAIVGRTIGGVEGYKYSKTLAAMGEEGKVWDEAALDGFLEKPKSYAKGTKMSFAGLKKESDRKALIAYLSTLTE